MTGKEFARKIFSPIIWLNLLGMVLVVILYYLGINWWMKSYTHHGEGIDVPDVKGMLVGDAQMELSGKELDCIVVDSTYHADLRPGIVLDQNPGPGSRVKAGRPIFITINAKYEPTLPIPNIIENCSYREAEARLKSLGFTLGTPEYRSGQKDWVLGVKCKGRQVSAGDRVAISTPIILIIGNNDIEVDENEIVYEDNWTNPYEETIPATMETEPSTPYNDTEDNMDDDDLYSGEEEVY